MARAFGAPSSKMHDAHSPSSTRARDDVREGRDDEPETASPTSPSSLVPSNDASPALVIRHTVVVSDVHLGEAPPSAAASESDWMFYRQSRFYPDADLRSLVTWIAARLGAADALDFVLDGDVFELEGPRVRDGVDVFDESPRTEEDALDRTKRIVEAHEGFFAALASLVDLGHRVVFVAGNHDAQLTFAGVQALVRSAVAERAAEASTALERVRVEPWFYQTRDGLHVEHGHQYDTYCSFRDPLRPLDESGRVVFPTLGSLAFRRVMSRMGHMNAYDERSYMLSFGRYLRHWVRYYLFTRRSMALVFLKGAIQVVRELLRSRPSLPILAVVREQARLARKAYAETLEVDAEALEAHARLFAPPADEQPYRVVQEFHLDNMVLGAVGLAGIITAAFKPRLGLAMAMGALAAGIMQELLRPRKGTQYEQKRVDRAAREVSRIYGAKAVVFGHTHVPHAEVEDGVFFANTGAWAPQGEGSEPAPEGRPVVWLRRSHEEDEPRLEGGLYRWREGELRPQVILGETEETQPRDVPAEQARDEDEALLPIGLEPLPA
jgi:UDP-2,3-diacylglucosamine pyrophosphatase LpxH